MSPRPPLTRPLAMAVTGWLLLVVFAGFMAVVGDDSAGNVALFAVLGLAMAAWVGLRSSRPALWVSLVLGLLQTVEQAAYLVADAGDGGAAAAVVGDVVGLLAGLLVVAGTGAALRARRPRVRRRRTPPDQKVATV